MHASPSPTLEYTRGPADARGRSTAAFDFDSDEGWTVHGELVRTERGVVIRDLQVSGSMDEEDDPRPITAGLLRRIPIGEIIAGALEDDMLPATDGKPSTSTSRQPQPGRQPLSDDLIRAVAEAYLAETGPGMPRGAIKRLSERFGKPAPTISRWVMRAREDGWLGPGVPGREGGAPGFRLLAAHDDELLARLAAPPKFTEPPEE